MFYIQHRNPFDKRYGPLIHKYQAVVCVYLVSVCIYTSSCHLFSWPNWKYITWHIQYMHDNSIYVLFFELHRSYKGMVMKLMSGNTGEGRPRGVFASMGRTTDAPQSSWNASIHESFRNITVKITQTCIGVRYYFVFTSYVLVETKNYAGVTLICTLIPPMFVNILTSVGDKNKQHTFILG